MEAAFRLFHGRAQLRGTTIGIGEEPRVRAARKRAAAPPASAAAIEAVTGTIEVIAPEPSVSVIEMVAAESVSVDTIEVATVEPTSVAKRKDRPRIS